MTEHTGLPKGYKRATFVVQEKVLEQLACVKYWERKTMREIVEDALMEYLSQQPERVKRPK